MNTAGSQLGHARNPSPSHVENGGGGTDKGSLMFSSNISNSSAFKERDYIGLSDSSSASTQRSNFTVSAPMEQQFSKSDFGLDCKDTELRLGPGLSLEHQGDASRIDVERSVPSGQRATQEGRTDCSIVEIGTLKTGSTQQSPLPELKRVPESFAYTGKVYPEQCISDKNGSTSSSLYRVTGSHTHGAIGSHVCRESSKVQWSDEQYFLNQRAAALPPPAAENPMFSVRERYCNQQLTGLNRITKENSVGLSSQHVLPAENNFSNDGVSLLPKDISRLEAPFGNNHSLPLRCNYELRYAQHELLASTERSSHSLQASQKPWPKSLPNDSFRSSLSSGNISEFDASSKACEALPRSMFIIPVPNTTVPAKRPFFETIGDSRIFNSSESRSETRANVSGVGATSHTVMNPSTFAASNMDGEMKPGVAQATKVHPASGLFSWNNVIPQQAGRLTGAEHSKGLFSSNVPASTSLPRGQAPSQPKATCASGMEPVTEAPSPSFPVKQTSNENHSGDGGSRAPVVGWPPIRSFRKNTLASQKRHADQEQDPTASPTDANEQVKQPSSTTLFVKANMDGVPIGRKVDLKSYDSYDSLKSALQDMFQRFMNGPTALGMVCASNVDHKQFNLLDGTEYVLTHEDRDGDWMLVGDVPWNMFVTTVKRLRIMKVSEAIGLGSKLKIQSSNDLVEGARGK